MKSKIIGCMFLLGALAILGNPAEVLSQRGPPGVGDANRLFDILSRGRGYFLAEDMRQMREPMTQWLQKRGITDGKVTRELFATFQEEARSNPGGMMTMFSKGGGPGSFGFKGGPGGFPGMQGPGGMPFIPGGGPGRSAELSIAELTRFGEMEFRRKDYNGDTVLTPEEMEPRLRENLAGWDKNRDGLISVDEFQPFFMSKMNERGGDGAKFNPVTIIIEEELDKRPTMFRAGKDVPKEIRWFAELDTDKDGQVSFYEWRKAKKDMDDFTEYDRNADGLMTAEEAMYYQKKNGSTMLASSSSSNESPSVRSEKGGGPRSDGGNKNGTPRFEVRSEGSKGNNGNSKMKSFEKLSPEERAKKFEEWKKMKGKG